MSHESREIGFTTQEALLFLGCVAVSFYYGRKYKADKRQRRTHTLSDKVIFTKMMYEAGLEHLTPVVH